jgi:hypothetical protein
MYRRHERRMPRFDRQIVFRFFIEHGVRRSRSHAAAAKLRHDIARIRHVSIRLVKPIKSLQPFHSG